MRTAELDGRMRGLESALDPGVLPGVFMAARLDGRNFTRLTKEDHTFETPFDPRFHDLMLQTAEHLMAGSGFGVLYAYTQSDEISLLLGRDEGSFGRRLRKVVSVLSGEASARFSLLVGSIAVFDCRVAPLPTEEFVVDYFRWRSEDAHRNALNAHCYWLLRKQGRGTGEATEALRGLPASAKNELLYRAGINYNDLPAWQRRGSGLCWEGYERVGGNPLTGEEVVARRRRILRNMDLPVKDAYSEFLRGIVGP
jgi:tRNA(His) guanylyltransferase